MAGRRLQTALCRSTVSQQSVTHERDNGNVSAPENAASGVSCRLNSPSVFEITGIVPGYSPSARGYSPSARRPIFSLLFWWNLLY